MDRTAAHVGAIDGSLCRTARGWGPGFVVLNLALAAVVALGFPEGFAETILALAHFTVAIITAGLLLVGPSA